MSDSAFPTRPPRDRTLLIVEGRDKERVILEMIIDAFPQIPIDKSNILCFETHAFNLIKLIKEEYGSDWFASPDMIDLPLLIGRQKGIRLYGRHFSNIFLVFDIERHTASFSAEEIVHLQSCFSSPGDLGVLLLNYPMVESLYCMKDLHDESYLSSTVSTNFQNGKSFKRVAERGSRFFELEKSYRAIRHMIFMKTRSCPLESRESATLGILGLSDKATLCSDANRYLSCAGLLDEKKRYELSRSLENVLCGICDLETGESFLSCLRPLLMALAVANLKKAWYIQHGTTLGDNADLRDAYAEIDWNVILEKQIGLSNVSEEKTVWVLCAMVTILGEYKIFGKELDKPV